MRLDSRQAHPPSRFEVRAAHDLAVEHRPRGHRRHPALQRRLPLRVPGRAGDAPHRQLRGQWHRIRNEAGLPGLRIHDLRHNWASTAAMNGVDMVTVAKLLGHALVETEACPPCRRAPGRSGGEGRSLHRRRRWYGTAARRSAIEAPALRPLRQELSAPQARRAPGQWSKAAPLCGALDNVFMPNR